MVLYVLFESASGYALFERVESELIGEQLDEVQDAIQDMGRFGRMVHLKAFVPFSSAENALSNINDVSEGLMNETLKAFLAMNVPKTKKKAKGKIVLGVCEERLGSAIQDALGIQCEKSQTVRELTRGIRLHFHHFIPALKSGDLEKAQLGLGHSYSRCKVKFNVHRQDNMIIQSICLLDQLDKDLNTFAMRVREWYSYHFPELIKIVPDNYTFCKLAEAIGRKNTLSEDDLDRLEAITGDAGIANQILQASKSSMGTDISDIDLINISHFVKHVVSLTDYRHNLHAYLQSKMHCVAPNLAALIGEQVGARLISHAGSLTNLAKYPASTVQILGAEKALFRALKTRGNTPKYGLIFNSSFIGRASTKNKGRISRYLANKCSIASRIDSFSENPSDAFGKVLKEQVEERLAFFDTGVNPRRNIDVMKSAMEHVSIEAESAVPDASEATKTKKKKKRKRSSEDAESSVSAQKEKPKKKRRKEKGSKAAKKVEEPEVPQSASETPKKKRKRKKKKKKKSSS